MFNSNEEIKMTICIAIFVGAIIQDLILKKVKNYYILMSFILVLSYQLFSMGVVGSIEVYKNILLAFAVGFFFFSLKIIGAGDAKVFIVISILLPISGVINSFIYSLFWGGMLGLFRSILSGHIRNLIQNIFLLQNMILFSKKINQTSLNLQTIPYTIPLFLGVMMDWTLNLHGIHFL